MRAVLDTNVLISAVLSTGTPHQVVVAGLDGEYQIVASAETLDEFRDTLLNYPDRFGLEVAEVYREVETVRHFADIVEPVDDVRAVVADPDDDKFLEAAVAGDAAFIVTGDQHILDLGSFRGLT